MVYVSRAGPVILVRYWLAGWEKNPELLRRIQSFGEESRAIEM